MSGLQFGLNIKKKTGPVLAKPRPAASRPAGGRNAFGDHSSDEDNLDDDDESSAATTTSSAFASRSSTSTSSVNKTLRPYAMSTLQSTSVIEQQNAALAQDATIFDYDGVFDQLKAVDRVKELARKQDSLDRKPKYVNALLQAAETRKRDRQIAEEKRIEREREKEGDLFKDKEQFITPAYKAQKEAMRLAEEEDRKKEELLAKDKDGLLMQGFYRTMLDERTKLRPGAVTTTSEGISKEALEVLEKEKQERQMDDRQRAMEARERGLNVILNDEGEIVDKRELLKGGLNIMKKPTVVSSSSSSSSRSDRDRQRSSTSTYDRDGAYAAYKESKYRSSQSHGRSRDEDPSQDQRARMTEQIERQLMEQEKQREEEEKTRQDSIREALKRKNQDDQVMDAKARYLARKKAAEDAKKDS